MLKAALLLFAIGLGWTLPGTVHASGETVDLSMEAEASDGALYREMPLPVRAKLNIKVAVPETADEVTPTIRSRVTFPADMGFHPDPATVCPASAIGPQVPLGNGIPAVVSRCPDSVVGTGTAKIHLARSRTLTLDDPQLVIFNGGRVNGRPKIIIYAYSKGAGAGILMSGVFAKTGVLDIGIGVLPFDSSIAEMTLGVPGDPLVVDGGTETISGLDPGFLRAKCSSGEWAASGRFTFAERNESTGQLTTDPLLVDSNRYSLPCAGRQGQPRLAPLGIRGPKRYPRKGSRVIRVKLSNPGTATARGLKLVASGAGSGAARVGKLAPRTSKEVAVRLKFRGNRTARRVIRITVSGKGLRRQKTIRISRSA